MEQTGVAIETDFSIRNWEIKMHIGGYFDRGATYHAQLKREVREYSPARPLGGPKATAPLKPNPA